jgi:alpha-tubulin suppressor-like RCC1 family protein
MCWGRNEYGQVGDGTTTTRRITPVYVTGLAANVIAISAGYYHSCAIKNTGEVKCWGYNYYGQVGDGTTTNRATPRTVSGLTSGVSAISGGGTHTCALTSTGGVKCWGNNKYGQLGDRTYTNKSTPADVFGLTAGITAISAGGYHTYALTNTNGIKGWGYNQEGALGYDGIPYQTTPVDVVGLTLW